MFSNCHSRFGGVGLLPDSCSWYMFLEVGSYLHSVGFSRALRHNGIGSSFFGRPPFRRWGLVRWKVRQRFLHCVDVACLSRSLTVGLPGRAVKAPDGGVVQAANGGVLKPDTVLVQGMDSITDGERIHRYFQRMSEPLCVFSLVQTLDQAVAARAAIHTWAKAEKQAVFFLPFNPMDWSGKFADSDQLQVISDALLGLPTILDDSSELGFFRWPFQLFEKIREKAVECNCLYSMVIPANRYVNLPAVRNRLLCIADGDAAWSRRWLFGVFRGARFSDHPDAPDMPWFLDFSYGIILSLSSLLVTPDMLLKYCRSSLPNGFPMVWSSWFTNCMASSGLMAENYADDADHFIDTTTYPNSEAAAMQKFVEHPEAKVQCLFAVGPLNEAGLYAVHAWLTRSLWFEAIPCSSTATQNPSVTMVDHLGRERPYFSSGVFESIYYCKDRRLVHLEFELQHSIPNISLYDPPLALLAGAPPRKEPTRDLCVFIPVSFDIPGTQALAEAVLDTWADENTFFVNPATVPVPDRPRISRQTISLRGDFDTNYAQLPVRTHRILTALGTDPKWKDECRW